MRVLSAGELAERLGARLLGDAAVQLSGLGSLEHAGPGQLSHLSSRPYRRLLAGTRASAVLLREADAAACPCTALVVDEPYVAYAEASRWFAPAAAAVAGIDVRASLHASSQVDPTAHVGPGVVIGAGTIVGARCVIGANTVIGAGCTLAEDVRLYPNVTLYDDVHLGARSVVHSATVIGADGFGYARDRRGVQRKIAQLGGVRIGADVEIGASTTIDRGAIDDTVIEDGVKIDNQVQVGHNCHIGAHTVICGCVGIVGSTRIGSHCVLGGGVGVGGDGPVTLAKGVVVSGMSHVAQSVEQPGVYSAGTLLAPTREWKRNALRLRELDALARRLRALERRLGALPPEA
jgi:UDP-3-O-[3-hydroxymyristoyl] glucosamine N-acyltransferase